MAMRSTARKVVVVVARKTGGAQATGHGEGNDRWTIGARARGEEAGQCSDPDVDASGRASQGEAAGEGDHGEQHDEADG